MKKEESKVCVWSERVANANTMGQFRAVRVQSCSQREKIWQISNYYYYNVLSLNLQTFGVGPFGVLPVKKTFFFQIFTFKFKRSIGFCPLGSYISGSCCINLNCSKLCFLSEVINPSKLEMLPFKFSFLFNDMKQKVDTSHS